MASKRGKLTTLPEKMNMVKMIEWLQEKAEKNIFRSKHRMTDTAAREEVADVHLVIHCRLSKELTPTGRNLANWKLRMPVFLKVEIGSLWWMTLLF